MGQSGGWTLAGMRCGFTWWVPHPPWTAHQPPFLGLLYRFKAFRNVEFLKTNSFISFFFFGLQRASEGCSSLRCMGFSMRWLLSLRSTGSRRAAFSNGDSWALEHRHTHMHMCIAVAHRLRCSEACGIFPDRGSTHVSCAGRQLRHHWATSSPCDTDCRHTLRLTGKLRE